MGVPTPANAGRLFRFDRLDSSGYAIPVYTIGWRILDQSSDTWSRRFLAYKADDDHGFMGGSFILLEAVKELLAQRGLDAKDTAIATALSSKHTGVNKDSVLNRTGVWIAKELGMEFCGEAFTKRAHRSLHDLKSRSDREAEVKDAYACAKLTGISTVIILDDFVTGGSTLADMKRALQVTNPSVDAVGLALGKSERASYASDYGLEVSNAHIPAQWNSVWIEKAKLGDKK